MPQADKTITVHYLDEPTGILYDVSGDSWRVMSALENRLHNIDAILMLSQQADDLPKVVSHMVSGVRDLMEDCFTLIEHHMVTAHGTRLVGAAA